MSDIKKKKEDTIEPFEDINLRRTCDPLPDIPTSVPDYLTYEMPKIEFNAEDHSFDSINMAIDSIKTAILTRHPMTYDTKVETLGKYSLDDLNDMYAKGLNDGMKRAVEPDSPLIECIVKRAMDKLYKSKEIELTKTGEWIILKMSMEISGTSRIKYKCSNCEEEFTYTTFSRELPKYCENCGSKNPTTHKPDVAW